MTKNGGPPPPNSFGWRLGSGLKRNRPVMGLGGRSHRDTEQGSTFPLKLGSTSLRATTAGPPSVPGWNPSYLLSEQPPRLSFRLTALGTLQASTTLPILPGPTRPTTGLHHRPLTRHTYQYASVAFSTILPGQNSCPSLPPVKPPDLPNTYLCSILFPPILTPC